MAPPSQYQARRFLDRICANRTTVRPEDYVDRDLWGRVEPPLRGFIFTDRNHARTNLLAGHLCALTPTARDLASPSPPVSPSGSIHSPSTSSLSDHLEQSTNHTDNPHSQSTHPDDSVVPSPLKDVERGPIYLNPIVPPSQMPRVESTNSRVSKVSSVPSFGKMVDPLSAESIRLDSTTSSSNRTSATSGLASRHERRTNPEFEEFGNEVLITNFDDDLHDDYDLEPENPSALFRAIGPSVSEKDSPHCTEYPVSTGDRRHPPDEAHCKSNFDKINHSTHAVDRTLSDEIQYVDADRYATSESQDTYSETMHSALSESDTPHRSVSSSIEVIRTSTEADRLLCEHPTSNSLAVVNLHRSSTLASKHSLQNTLVTPPSPPPPPQPQLFSAHSYPHVPPSPMAPTDLSSIHFHDRSSEDEGFDDLPRHPVSPPRAPSMPDMFAIDELNLYEEGQQVPMSEPASLVPTTQLDESSPVTETGTYSDGLEREQSGGLDEQAPAVGSQSLYHTKPVFRTNSRSYLSSSDYFSRSEYTGFSDFSRRIDSSVEVETSDEEGVPIHELDEDAWCEAEALHYVTPIRSGGQDSIIQGRGALTAVPFVRST